MSGKWFPKLKVKLSSKFRKHGIDSDFFQLNMIGCAAQEHAELEFLAAVLHMRWNELMKPVDWASALLNQ